MLRFYSRFEMKSSTKNCTVKQDSRQDVRNANSQMVGRLDRFRKYLVDQGPAVGVTNVFSGDSIKEISSDQ